MVAGNWKLNGSRAGNDRLLDGLLNRLPGDSAADVLVCPPFVYLADVVRALRDSIIQVGGQDVCAEAAGAYTGEVSAAMLRDVGCQSVIVGHSERRALYAESESLVARKFAAALAGELTPILCVGEQLADREQGRTREVVARQLDAVVDLCGIQSFARAVVAYEPVWAIGTGRTASPEQAQEVHAFIRGRLAERDANIAGSLRVLYGGSVKAANAAELFGQPDVDGGLIGGASLQAEEFAAIVAAAG
ncbi:MAG: triose-phosphate isomerase [Steroidobacteraceae bacterium]